jgi:hypothetical protein
VFFVIQANGCRGFDTYDRSTPGFSGVDDIEGDRVCLRRLALENRDQFDIGEDRHNSPASPLMGQASTCLGSPWDHPGALKLLSG